MATVVNKYSLYEQQKRLDPDGKNAKIVEQLSVEMELLQDAPWMPSNDIWVNKTVRRASLPSGSRRKLNQGIAAEVSRVTEALDKISMIESYAEFDKAYIDSYENPAEQRALEVLAFIEGLSQTLVSDILYGNNTTTPEAMHGFQPRLATIDSKYVWGSGGTGDDNTSIYVVNWGPNQVFLAHPKNMASTLGVQHTNLGVERITDSGGTNKFVGYVDHFKIDCGLVVKDLRCVGRVANIEVTGSSNIFNEDNLIKLLNKMKTGPGTRIYVNETIQSQMDIALKDKNNVNYTSNAGEGLAGEPVTRFRGFPVRKIDSTVLVNTESTIS